MPFRLQFSNFLGIFARMWREANSSIVAVERISEYIGLESEADWRIQNPAIHRGLNRWPSEGRITFSGFSLRYRPELDPVLHDLSFQINTQEKVGVVGRTGAGIYNCLNN